MAHYDLAEMKLLQRDNASVDTALSAFEQGVFKNNGQHADKEHVANDVAPDTLRYLFAIFR